jgi:hypothetical protein
LLLDFLKLRSDRVLKRLRKVRQHTIDQAPLELSLSRRTELRFERPDGALDLAREVLDAEVGGRVAAGRLPLGLPAWANWYYWSGATTVLVTIATRLPGM